MLQSNKYEIVAKNSRRPNLSLSYNELKLRKRYYFTGDFLHNIQRNCFLRIQLFLFIENSSEC